MIVMEEMREPFNLEDWISNEKTPVETRDGHVVKLVEVNQDSVAGVISVGHIWDVDRHVWDVDRNKIDRVSTDVDLFFKPEAPYSQRLLKNKETMKLISEEELAELLRRSKILKFLLKSNEEVWWYYLECEECDDIKSLSDEEVTKNYEDA